MKPNQALKEWVEANPLRRFRKENGITMMQAASMMGVGMSSVQLWEKGAQRPGEESLKKIGTLVRDPKISETWQQWYAARPGSLAEEGTHQ